MFTDAPVNQPDLAQAITTIPTSLVDPNLLKAALWYAGHGYYVFPVHKPLFDHLGQCIGCTCEHYKRSQAYRQVLEARGCGHQFNPHYTCPQPGKCPAVTWRAKSTNERAQILKWWGHSWHVGPIAFTPNIGLDCGKSGLLVLDLDKYKDSYAGDHLLSWSDQQTVTSISGGGGQHLYFARGDAEYGNANGNLPDGIDIRGVGGYIIAPPSLHHSGRPYQWETNYGVHELAPQPIPENLRLDLEVAYQKKLRHTAMPVTFGPRGAHAPDLAKWDLPTKIVELLATPAPQGHRSEQDMKVIVALCAAGASDDDVMAVFTHHPIGTHGKFAEKGRYGEDYLAVTIANARAYLAGQEQVSKNTLATIAELRFWLRTHSFSEYIPTELRKAIYRTDSTDHKVADAVCDLFAVRRSLTIRTGKKTLARYAGVSPNTVTTALHRLQGWLYSVSFDPDGLCISLSDAFVSRMLTPFHNKPANGGQFTPIEKYTDNEYSPRKATNPFLTGSSRKVKDKCRDAVIVAGGTPKEWLATIPRGLGETCLRVLDALHRCGEMAVTDLVANTGKTLGAIRRACRRLEVEELVESTREHSRAPKVYELMPDAWQQVETLTPTLRTHLLSEERADRQLRDSQRWVVAQKTIAVKTGDAVRVKELDKQLTRLGNQRLKYLSQIYADKNLMPSEVARLAFDIQVPSSPHPALVAKFQRFHGDARIQVTEARREEKKELQNKAYVLKADGVDQQVAARMLQFAGYTANQVWQVVHSVWPALGN